MYKRRKSIVLLLLILIVMGLGACGGLNPNVASGMEEIRSLNYQVALDDFQKALEAGESSRLICRGMGIAYMGLTDYENAVSCFEEALHLSSGLLEPMDFDLNYYLAAAYGKCMRLQDAENIYNAILNMRPQEAEAYFLRGNVRMQLGKPEDGQADFAKVLEMEPQNYDRLIQIYQVLDNYGYTQAGQAYLQEALTSENNGKMTAYDRGRIYYYLGEYQNAYMALEEARSGGGSEAYLYLGRAYEATGDYNYAANVYNAYLAQSPGNAEIYNQLGLCELQKGEYQKALDAFQAGLALENNDIVQTLSFNEIVAYEYLGDFKRAAVLMETYLKNYPDDTKAQREYTFLNTR